MKADELERNGWDVDDESLIKQWEFDTFEEAIEFVNELALLAEEHQHHPDIDIRYTTVAVELYTHEADRVTEQDIDLASAIESL
jgi:4a-hydroxytetrahydrobiopterin dehydratase